MGTQQLSERAVMTVCGPFNRQMATKLQEAYNRELSAGSKSFMFELADGTEHELLTDFAKYLLEFLGSNGLLK